MSNSPLILDGNALATELKQSYIPQIKNLIAEGCQPCLAVIIVGDDQASKVYVKNKIADCKAVGIRSLHYALAATTKEQELLDLISQLNHDASVHGILVQLPIPKHIDIQKILCAIDPNKDVDAFHPQNVAALMQGEPRFLPCTPHGIMRLLDKANIQLSGKNAVVIGRSNIVGKPMALLLLAAGCTVTICHSKTENLAAHLKMAEIVVAAVGVPRMIKGEMLKQGAVVIDVGINRITSGVDAGKICGDVDYVDVLPKVFAITPVPGGVGPMTRAMLLENTLISAANFSAYSHKTQSSKTQNS